MPLPQDLVERARAHPVGERRRGRRRGRGGRLVRRRVEEVRHGRSCPSKWVASHSGSRARSASQATGVTPRRVRRSEEHTSELQSRLHLVCRLLLEKKKKTQLTST